MPLASAQPSPWVAPAPMKTGRGAAESDKFMGVDGRSFSVSGPSYLRKLPAIQWYSPEPATLPICSPKLRR